jgi:hypothetical protein
MLPPPFVFRIAAGELESILREIFGEQARFFFRATPRQGGGVPKELRQVRIVGGGAGLRGSEPAELPVDSHFRGE